MVVACLTMLIDHIGFMFFPEMVELRLIGRISMPIYAYCIANGYIHTRSRKSYIKRITVIAFLSQLPFSFVVEEWKLNICFTWLIGIAVLWCIDEIKKQPEIKIPVLFFSLIITECVPMDYGIMAVLWVVLFYSYPKLKSKYRNYYMGVSGILISLIRGLSTQLFSVISFAVIWLCERHNLKRIKNEKLK